MDQKHFIESLVKSWPAPFVARSETKRFTGGSLVGRTVANIECREPENRVPGRMVIGRKVVYPTRSFAEWIARRLLKDA
jgi:hypothetical protein